MPQDKWERSGLARLIIRANKLLYRPLLATLITRLDNNPTKADWELWIRDLDARLTAAT